MSRQREGPDAMDWVEPPPKDRGRYDWPKIAAHLQAHPNEWLKVFDDGPTSTVNAIRQGAVPDLLPGDGFEVTTRNNVKTPKRRCTLYLRWVPKGE